MVVVTANAVTTQKQLPSPWKRHEPLPWGHSYHRKSKRTEACVVASKHNEFSHMCRRQYVQTRIEISLCRCTHGIGHKASQLSCVHIPVYSVIRIIVAKFSFYKAPVVTDLSEPLSHLLRYGITTDPSSLRTQAPMLIIIGHKALMPYIRALEDGAAPRRRPRCPAAKSTTRRH
jgi:hypothetical protein